MRPLLALPLLAMACGAPPVSLSQDETTTPPENSASAPNHDVSVANLKSVFALKGPVNFERSAPIRVCVDVPLESLVAVRAAVDGWRSATKSWRSWRYVERAPDWSNCDLMIATYGANSPVCDGEAFACTTNPGGLARGEWSGVLLPARGAWTEAPTGVVMHEIGHSLGLTHKDGGLMQAEWPAAWRFADWICPDAETLDRLQTSLGARGFEACELPNGL